MPWGDTLLSDLGIYIIADMLLNGIFVLLLVSILSASGNTTPSPRNCPSPDTFCFDLHTNEHNYSFSESLPPDQVGFTMTVSRMTGSSSSRNSHSWMFWLSQVWDMEAISIQLQREDQTSDKESMAMVLGTDSSTKLLTINLQWITNSTFLTAGEKHAMIRWITKQQRNVLWFETTSLFNQCMHLEEGKFRIKIGMNRPSPYLPGSTMHEDMEANEAVPLFGPGKQPTSAYSGQTAVLVIAIAIVLFGIIVIGVAFSVWWVRTKSKSSYSVTEQTRTSSFVSEATKA